MLAYIVLAIVATVVAPLSTVPLLPLGATLWGPRATALLSIAGWEVGASIAYLIARRFGRPLASYLIDLTQADTIAARLAGTHTF